MSEREATWSVRALVPGLVFAWAVGCSGSEFQADDGAGGGSGAGGDSGQAGASGGGAAGSAGFGLSGAENTGGATAGGATAGGADGGTASSGGSANGGTNGGGTNGGTSSGGASGGTSSGGANSGGTANGGAAGFGVAGIGGIGGGTVESCGTLPGLACFSCCQSTIGNASFLAVTNGCACSGPCASGACNTHCVTDPLQDPECEACTAETLNGASSVCASDAAACLENTLCQKYWSCVSGCEI